MSGSRYPAQGSGNYATSAYHVDTHRYIDPSTGQRIPPITEYPSGLSTANFEGNEPLYPATAHRLPPIEVYTERAEGPADFNAANLNYDEDDLASSQSSQSRRKPKSHVDKACVYCQKKHLACDVNRPCRRCIENGVAEHCHSVPHKKRGRPPHANKEGRGGRSQRGGPDFEQSPPVSQYSASNYDARLTTEPQRAQHYPLLPSQSAVDTYRHSYDAQQTAAYYGHTQYTTSSFQSVPTQSYLYGHPPLEAASQPAIPTACLTIGLEISHANMAFKKTAGCFKEPRGDKLESIIGDNHLIMLHALSTELKTNAGRAARTEDIPRPEDFKTTGVDSRADFTRALTFKHQAGVHNAVFTLCRSGIGDFVIMSFPYSGVQVSLDHIPASPLGHPHTTSTPAYHQGEPQSRQYVTHGHATTPIQPPRYTPNYSIHSPNVYPGSRSQVPPNAYHDASEPQRGYVAEYMSDDNSSYATPSYNRSNHR